MWCLQILAVSSSWTRLNSWFHHHQLTCWMLVNYFSLPNFHFQEYMRMILTLGSFSGREDGRSAPRQCPIRATDTDPPTSFTPWSCLKGGRGGRLLILGETVGAVRTRPLKWVVKIFASFNNASHCLGCRVLFDTLRVGLRIAIASVRRPRGVFVWDATSRRAISPPLLGIIRFAVVLIRWWRQNSFFLWVKNPFLAFLNG